jgi:non-ribosomal peptide synthetase component F
VLALTTFCFDPSVLEIFLPLTSGAKIVLASTPIQKDGFGALPFSPLWILPFTLTPTTPTQKDSFGALPVASYTLYVFK